MGCLTRGTCTVHSTTDHICKHGIKCTKAEEKRLTILKPIHWVKSSAQWYVFQRMTAKVLLDSYQTQIRQLKMQPNLWIDSRVEGNSLIAYDEIEWCYVTIKRTSLKYKLFYFKNHNKKLCLSFNTLAALHQCTQ